MIVIDQSVKTISDEIATKSFNRSKFFPIDREFLEQYLHGLEQKHAKEFILYNFENGSSTYAIQFSLCLPELWEDLLTDDLIEILNSFERLSSFFTFIEFTYKYVEVDILDIIFVHSEIPSAFIPSIKEYIKNQYINFVKFEGDYFTIDEALGGIKYDAWQYIKQRLLIDKRLKPSLLSVDDLKKYIEKEIK